MSRFDVTLFEDDEVTPFWGTATEAGVPTIADFSTDAAHPRPYLREPKNWSATEVDFAAGTSTIGAVTIDVLDKRTDAADQDTGILTARLRDVVGKRALLRRERDGSMVTAFEGVVQGYSMGGGPEGLVVVSLSLRDAREREREQPLFSSNFVLFGLDGVQGPGIDYGALPGGGYLLDAVQPQPSVVAGGITHFERFDAGFEGIYGGYAAVASDMEIDLGGRGDAVQDPDGIFYVRDVWVRWRPVGGYDDEWVDLRDMPRVGLSMLSFSSSYSPNIIAGVGSNRWLGIATEQPFASKSVYFGSFDEADIPETGEAIEFQILAADITEATPFFWDAGTFGDLLREIYDGEHSPEGFRAIAYNEAGMDAFAAATPSARLIQTEPVTNMREWVERNIYAATGYAPAFDAEQKVLPVSWAFPADAASVPVIPVESIVPIGDWNHNSETVINAVEYTYLREGVAEDIDVLRDLVGDAVARVVRGETDELSKWERYFRVEVVRQHLDVDSIATFGYKKHTLTPVTVRSAGDQHGRPLSGDTADETGTQLAEHIGRDTIQRFRHGTPVLRAEALATDPVVGELTLGGWCRPQQAWFPATTGRRGPLGYMQVIAIDDQDPVLRRLTLVDSGVPDAANDPELSTGEDCLTGGTLVPMPSGRAGRVFLADGVLTNTCGHPVTLKRVLLIAGGGGGGTGAGGAGGGGGAGGVIIAQDVELAAGASVPVTVGAAGAVGATGEDSVLWLDADGTGLTPGVDPEPVAYHAHGGGAGGGPGDDGGSGGSGGGAGGVYPASGGGTHAGGGSVAGQGSDGGDGEDSGGLSTCQGAAGGGGGSYGGFGGHGDATQTEAQQPVGGIGGPATVLPDFGVTAGGGGSGAAGVQDAGGACTAFFTLGAPGTGIGAGGGGNLTGGTQGIVIVEYAGPAMTLDTPTVTSTELDTDTNRVTICVEEAEWPTVALDGYRVRMDYAVAATEPAATSGEWRTAGYLDAPGCVTTPALPTGAKVWSRALAEASGFLPSTPTTAVEDDAPETPGLLAHQLTIDADGIATVTWDPNAFAGVVRIRGLIHDDTIDPVDLERPLAFIADVSAAIGTYTLPGVVGEEEYYTTDLESWGTSEPPTQLAPLLIDDFNRPNQSGWGGDWTIRSGTTSTWEIVGNAGRNDASATEVIENVAAQTGEALVQARLFSADYTTSQPKLVARFDWGGGSIDGYILGPDPTVPGWRLSSFVAGAASTLDSGADTLVAANSYDAQLYVADGVQQAWGNGISLDATDTSHDGQDARTVAARKTRLSGGQIVTWDDLLWFATKNVIVRATGLAAGWKAKLLNAAASVVAEATESGGVATVDCSRYGGATELVPLAGWAAVIVTDAADVELARYEPGSGIYPGLDATYVGGTLAGVGGQGLTYRLSEQQPALVGAAADLAAHLADLGNPHQVTAAQVGLGLVENVALSTWAGSANITTVGTLVAGAVPASLLTGTIDSARLAGGYEGITSVGTLANLTVAGTTQISATTSIVGADLVITRVGLAAAAQVFVDGDAGSSKSFVFRSGGLNRWAMRSDSVAESGGNVGSRFVLNARTDAGANLDNPLIIERQAGGAITLTRPVAMTASLALASAQKLYLDGVAATGDTYIHEGAANVLDLVVGGITALSVSASTVIAGVDLEVRRATGTATITPAVARIRSISSADDWAIGAANFWGAYDFWSDDASGIGVGVRARISAHALSADGAQTGLAFWVSHAVNLRVALEIDQEGVFFLPDVNVEPAGNPSGGIWLWARNGRLRGKGEDGTIRTIVPR